MKEQALLKITGRVQGVCYRDGAQERAMELGLKGWVRNSSDGSVELLAQGEKQQIEKLIKWCWEGPSSAQVKNIKVEWKTIPPQETGFRSFDITW